jgi:hypothetical protein
MFVLFNLKQSACDRYLRTALNWIVDIVFHQSDQFVTDFCTVITENCTVITKNCTVIANFALLLFEINCTEINQSQSSNILCILLWPLHNRKFYDIPYTVEVENDIMWSRT